MAELVDAFRQVTETSAFAGGPFVARFETEFAAFCQTRHALGVGSGADALWLTLLALGVGHGDEVVTAPNSFMATAEAISLCGARPVFVDIDERTYTMDPAQLEEAITLRTQAIVPVHIFGQMADMDAIRAVARRHGTPVVEDACQAHGAEHKGRRAGSLGVAGCFSFYPGKNLGAFGEAGAVTTDEPELRSRIQIPPRSWADAEAFAFGHRLERPHGRNSGGGAEFEIAPPCGCRMPPGRAHAQSYDQFLAGEPGIIRPVVVAQNRHAYHIYAVRVQDRDGVLERMAAHGVNCAIHYPCRSTCRRLMAFLGWVLARAP